MYKTAQASDLDSRCAWCIEHRLALANADRMLTTAHKRKAESELNGDANGHEAKRIKPSTSPEPLIPPPANDEDEKNDTHGTNGSTAREPVIPFPEKPAVIEERNGDISFYVVNNDGKNHSSIILTGLKCIFQKQLPKMPKDYIARLVYDRTHLSIAIVKRPPAGSFAESSGLP